jgi:hypothetical protein
MTSDRFAALAGVTYVGLALVLGAVEGSPPSPSASTQEVTAYLAGHRTGAGLWLFGLASIALLWWFGELWALMSRAENGKPRLAVVSTTGLVVGGAMSFASAVLMATLALLDSPEGAATLNAVAALFVTTAGFGLGTHLIAANILGVRSRIFGPAVIGFGFVSAFGFLAAAVLGAVRDDGVPNLLSLIGFLLWLLWILGVSLRMWREGERPAPAPLSR